MLYKALVVVIQSGNYDKATMLNNMDFYLLKGRITQNQYEELEQLMQ